MRLLKFLFFLDLLLFPLGEILRFNLTNDVAIKPLDISIGATVLIYIFVCVRDKNIPRTYINKQVALFGVIGILSLLVNAFNFTHAQLFVSFLYLVRWFAYLAIYFITTQFDYRFKKKILKILFLDGLIILVAGFSQYFLYPNLRNLYYLGWDEHNYRMFSVFLDPNFAGSFFVLFVLLVAGIVSFYVRKKRYKAVIVLSLVLVFTFIATFLTYSRSAILMFIFGVSSYLILKDKKKLLFIPFLIIAIIITLLLPTFNKENTHLLRLTSGLARIGSYEHSIEIIQDHPFLGVGFNSYRYAQKAYGFSKAQTQFASHADAGVDNSFLFILATMGVVGLSAYLYLWFEIFNRLLIAHRKNNRILPSVVIASLIGLLVNSFFINSLFFPEIMLWMWIIIGLSEDF